MSKTSPFLFCLGANHKSAGFELREKLFISRDEIQLALPHLRAAHGVRECIVLSTCNRLEIFGILSEAPTDDEPLFDAFLALRRFGRHEELPRPSLRKMCYIYSGREAVRHIFAVCAGLDSLVIGETQITGQFKDATAAAKEAETLGQILDRLSQEALASAKKVRTQTDIGKKTVSIGHAAIDLANQVYGSVSDHRVSIIGAGEMARLAARYTTQYKPRRLAIVNRTLNRAQELVNELGMGVAAGMEDLEGALAQSDIIIAATGSEVPIILRDLVERVQVKRNNRPLLFVDISMPRNVAHEIALMEDVYVFDIDDLKQVVDAHTEERRIAAEKAMTLISDSAGQFMGWLSTLAIKPVLSGFRYYLDELFERESNRTLTKEIFKNIEPAQREAIQKLLSSIANKITSDAGTQVRQPPAGYYSDQLAEALSVLFPRLEKSQEDSL